MARPPATYAIVDSVATGLPMTDAAASSVAAVGASREIAGTDIPGNSTNALCNARRY